MADFEGLHIGGGNYVLNDSGLIRYSDGRTDVDPRYAGVYSASSTLSNLRPNADPDDYTVDWEDRVGNYGGSSYSGHYQSLLGDLMQANYDKRDTKVFDTALSEVRNVEDNRLGHLLTPQIETLNRQVSLANKWDHMKDTNQNVRDSADLRLHNETLRAERLGERHSGRKQDALAKLRSLDTGAGMSHAASAAADNAFASRESAASLLSGIRNSSFSSALSQLSSADQLSTARESTYVQEKLAHQANKTAMKSAVAGGILGAL